MLSATAAMAMIDQERLARRLVTNRTAHTTACHLSGISHFDPPLMDLDTVQELIGYVRSLSDIPVLLDRCTSCAALWVVGGHSEALKMRMADLGTENVSVSVCFRPKADT